MDTSEKEVARYLAHLFMIFTVQDHLAYFKYWQSNCNHTAWRCNLTASMKHNMFHGRCCLDVRNAWVYGQRHGGPSASGAHRDADSESGKRRKF